MVFDEKDIVSLLAAHLLTSEQQVFYTPYPEAAVKAAVKMAKLIREESNNEKR